MGQEVEKEEEGDAQMGVAVVDGGGGTEEPGECRSQVAGLTHLQLDRGGCCGCVHVLHLSEYKWDEVGGDQGWGGRGGGD